MFFTAIIFATVAVGEAADGAIWSGLLNGFIWFLAVVACVVTVIIIMVRLCAAPALSVRQKGFRLFQSFAATKRIVGWLVLTYIVLIIIALAGSMVLTIVQQIAVMGGMMGRSRRYGAIWSLAPKSIPRRSAR